MDIIFVSLAEKFLKKTYENVSEVYSKTYEQSIENRSSVGISHEKALKESKSILFACLFDSTNCDKYKNTYLQSLKSLKSDSKKS